MNQTQRNFLIKKIEDAVKIRINALESDKEDAPSLNNYLLHDVMAGTFKIRSNEEIKEMIKQKALNSKAGKENWMSNTDGMYSSDRRLCFNPMEFFIIPEEFKNRFNSYTARLNKKREEAHKLRLQADGLITRIQLASDKTLQKMINEVDDMGDLSLMDTKLKLLN